MSDSAYNLIMGALFDWQKDNSPRQPSRIVVNFSFDMQMRKEQEPGVCYMVIHKNGDRTVCGLPCVVTHGQVEDFKFVL